MSTLTPETLGARSSRSKKRALAGGFVGLVAALALTLGVSTPSFAATGAQTGEWDVVAASAAQSPRLQSYEHEAGVWGTVTSPNAWFAVGSGKFIAGEEDASTPVSGGGIRFENTATTAKTPTFSFTVPANVGLKITDGTLTPVNVSASHSSAVTVTWSPGAVAAGSTYHHHFDWTFSGSGASSAVNLPVSVSVSGSGSGNYTASTTYRFTF